MDASGCFQPLVCFREKAEDFSGVNVTERTLKRAIETYNETRGLLRKVYKLRQRSSPPLTGAQSVSVIMGGLSLPKDRYNGLLGRLLEEMSEGKGISDYRARLMLSGAGGCEDPAYYQTIEDLGGLIVTDSLCFGSRYFWEPVKIDEDLMHSLATSYLNRPSCAGMCDQVSERNDYVKDMAERFNVDGIIYQRMQYCDLWGGQVLTLRQEMHEHEIPFLELEREYILGATGQLKTRAQAFLESIGG